MLFLSYAYRFLSNFVFLALVYFALNFLENTSTAWSSLFSCWSMPACMRRPPCGRSTSFSASNGWRGGAAPGGGPGRRT